MSRVRGWASRAWVHVATLLEKPNVPGVLPLTLGATGMVLAYLLFITIR